MKERPNILPVDSFCDMFLDMVDGTPEELNDMFNEFIYNYNGYDQGRILSFLAGAIHRFKEDVALK